MLITDEELQKKYDNNIQDIIKKIPNSKFIFEITKCCGYSTFILVYKKQTLLDLYKIVSLDFECSTLKSLYAKNDLGEKLTVPITELLTIKDFIIKYRQDYLKPIYPVPNQIVYKLYLDDGHTCTKCSQV